MKKLLAVGFLSFSSLIPNSPAPSSEAAFLKLRSATVHIAIGTGFILKAPSNKQYLITNWHVCNAGSWNGKMRANFEGGELVEGPIVKLDAGKDLCASRVNRSGESLRVSDSLQKRQPIYTRGYPFGVLSETSGRFIDTQSWSYFYPIESVGRCPKESKEEYDGLGHVSGCTVRYADNLTNMYSRPGSSGSPVVDQEGNLVGVMSSWLGDKDQGGMVRLEDIQKFVKDL